MFLFSGDWVYDIETYPNIFCVGFQHAHTGDRHYFEISPRRNDREAFKDFVHSLFMNNCRMVGFNNYGFDYPVIHSIIHNNPDIYDKAMVIIKGRPFDHIIWDNKQIVPQVDLFKIHHFDNHARSTSLKMLEFNMRMNNIEDLPFPVGIDLDDNQKDVLVTYMWHDIQATVDFYHKSVDLIRFREQLTRQYGKNFLNHNDTKIGKDYFIMKLEEAEPGCCFKYVDNKRVIQQTPRDSINLGDVILPYVSFNHPEFKRIHNWFKNKTITETKGSIKDLSCSIDGFQYDFGTGGIHGSVESQIVHSDDKYIIEDWDVASYYPNLAIVNKLHPEHLGENFCTVYKDMYEQRKTYAKGTPENAMLKLALNGTYGDSNSEYSPFYDPKFTMSITVNGQLLLCMLSEALFHIDVQMIQINTDGLTIRYPRTLQKWVHSVCKWWENLTGLELESAEYSRMFIRDVNNYIAEYVGGDLKHKGAYDYKPGWHQNHSQLIVPMAAEAALVRGEDVAEFIYNHENVMDFMLRTKVPRDSRLEWGGTVVPNIVRYYVSTDGDILEKVMPAKGPEGSYKRANGLTDDFYETILAEVGDDWDERIHTKNKSKYETRRTGYHTGYTVMLCNNLQGHTFADINYDYYIKEAQKLVWVLGKTK
jgi:hypothetical protein